MHQPFPSFGQVRVLDLTDRWGQFATRLLAQLGADVVIGEPPGGHKLRNAWPMAVLADGAPVSLYFWHFNMGKRSVLWDLDSAPGRGRAEALLQAADVVMVGRDAYRRVREQMPDALAAAKVVALSPYGLKDDGELGGDDLHVSAQSGFAGLSGYGDGEDATPIIPPAEQTMHAAGLYGAIAAVLALRGGIRDTGQLFDVSAQAAAFQATEQLFAHWAYRKEQLHPRTGGYATSRPSGRWQVAGVDGGYIYAFGLLPRTQREWDALRAWMRRENAVDDLDEPRFSKLADLRAANPYEMSDEGRHAAAVIFRFLQSIPAERAHREGQAIGLSWARVFPPEDVLGEEQYAARELLYPTAIRGGATSYLTQSLPWAITPQAESTVATEPVCPPEVGEHTDEVLAQWLGDEEAR